MVSTPAAVVDRHPSNSANVGARAETKALIGGGGVYSYIHVLPDEFLLKSVVITVDFKRNSSGRTRIYEYAPPPPINALVSALVGAHNISTIQPASQASTVANAETRGMAAFRDDVKQEAFQRKDTKDSGSYGLASVCQGIPVHF